MTRYLATAVLLLVVAGHANAQATGFVDGGAVLDIYPYGNAEAAPNPGVTAAIGASFPNRWTVRFEASFPHWKSDSYSFDCCPYGSGEHRTVTSRQRLDTFAGLAGREYPVARAITFTPLAGVSVVNAHYRSEVRFTTAGGIGPLERPGVESQDTMLAWVVGADVPIAVTARIAVVPQVRLHVAPNYESATVALRPAMTARLAF